MSATELDEDAARRAEELQALECIYSPSEFQLVAAPGGKEQSQVSYMLSIAMNVSSPTNIQTLSPKREIIVNHLPPVTLRFVLPKGYPSQKRPHFFLDAPFLSSKLPLVAEKLTSIAEEMCGDEVIFEWGEFLKNDLYDFLSLQDGIVIKKLSSQGSRPCDSTPSYISLNSAKIADPEQILHQCEEYSELRELQLFEETDHHCGICFETRTGEKCYKLRRCTEDHAFCRECLKGFFEARIHDGLVSENQICCPGQCGRGALPTEVKMLTDKPSFEKYDRLLLESAFDSMKDVMYCPRKNCGRIALRDEDEPRLVRCYYCLYSFCAECKRSYHAESCIDIDQYMNASESEKAKMEASMSISAKERAEALVFLKQEGGKQCPHCEIAITKTSGCNKMFCKRCGNSFCFLCGFPFHGEGLYAYGEHFGPPESKRCSLFDTEDEFLLAYEVEEIEDVDVYE